MNAHQTKALMAIGLAVMPSAMKAQHQDRPNVIFILADDLGWNDLGCMGSKFYETPNIDRIASEGMTFSNAYAACQVSSPSRASILTGQYTTRHGVTDWIGEAYGENWRRLNRHNKLLPAPYAMALPKDEYTLADCLRANGYTTFIAGKWHLGGKGSLPEDHGFDVNVGGWSAGSPVGGYFTPYNNPALKDGPQGENLSMRLSQEAVDFMTKQSRKKKSNPFFVYLSFYAVHAPIQCTPERWHYYRDKAEKMGIQDKGFEFDRTQPVRTAQDNPVYAGLISQMDAAVGNVLAAVNRLHLDRNTIIIFTSDNGGVVSGDDFSTCLFPLRGGKGRQWEGGIRVPLLICTPDMKQDERGKTCATPVSGIDFYPTIIDCANIHKPEQQVLDGVSLKPLLRGDSIRPRPLFWHYPHYGNQGGEPCSIIRQGDWKLIYYYEDGRSELYNLATDLGEHEPLNAQYPAKVKELKTLLQAWLIETQAKSPAPDMQYNPQAEAKRKAYWKTLGLNRLEKQRKDMLNPGWSPNKNWWNSHITID